MHSLRFQRSRPQVADQGPQKPEWGVQLLGCVMYFLSCCPLGHRVQGLILEISVSSVAHQGRPRIPVSQWQVNKSSDVYQDPSRCCQGPWRMLLREMTQGIGLDVLVSPLTSNLFPSPHICALRLIRRPMALLYGAITYWNWMRAGWSCIVSTERYGEAPHFTLLNASSLTLSKSRG